MLHKGRIFICLVHLCIPSIAWHFICNKCLLSECRIVRLLYVCGGDGEVLIKKHKPSPLNDVTRYTSPVLVMALFSQFQEQSNQVVGS